jgi:hypothetical protein
MAETEIKREPTTRRVVGVLSAIYYRQIEDPLTGKTIRGPVVAQHGEEIDLVGSEERRLEANGALLPEGAKSEDAQRHHDARLDAYRAERGDQEALARHRQRLTAAAESGGGDIVDVDAPVEGSVGELAAYLRDAKPSVDDTVALADGDPEKARKVLEAENTATGGSPRAGVKSGLDKIIG